MSIETLKMSGFRNYKEKSLEFGPGVNVIWGENGSGKTSTLEAIHILSVGKSFRTPRLQETIEESSPYARIVGVFISEKNKLDLQTKLKKSGSNKFNPWFSYQHKCLKDVDNIIFGHWAALNGVTNHNNIKGIDLGCVWGGSLAAINVEDKSIITVDSIK